MAAATARAKGRSKEGRETKRGGEKGGQPMTERYVEPHGKTTETRPKTEAELDRLERRKRGIGRGR